MCNSTLDLNYMKYDEYSNNLKHFHIYWCTGPWIEVWEMIMAVVKVLEKLIVFVIVIVIVVEPWLLVKSLKLILMVMHHWFKSGDLCFGPI
jgi:hypothetical protein